MAESFLQSLMGGYQLGSQIKQDRNQSKLAQLASQAYSAPQNERQGILAQAVGVDPKAGMALGDSLQGVDDQRTKTLVQAARYLTAAPESARPGIYQQMKGSLSQFGMQLPEQYDDTVAQTAQALVQAYGDPTKSGPYADLPSDIRSLKLLQENPDLAAIDKERRQYSGMVPKSVVTDQGFGWATPGGGIELAPLTGVAGGQAQPSANAPQLFAALGQKYGIQPTSTTRTPQHNSDVGGVPNSFHLSGQAADFVVPAQYKQQFAADARANGYEAIDEGDHIHIEPAGRRGGSAPIAQPRPNASETPDTFAPLSQDEVVALGMPPGTVAQRNVNTGEVKVLPSAAQPKTLTPAQQMKLNQNRKKETRMVQSMDASFDQSVKLIDDILAQRDRLGGVTGIGALGAKIPGTPWADLDAKLTTLKARSAFGSLQEMRANSPTGGALGNVSERELDLLQNAETQLKSSQSPEGLAAALEDYKRTLLNAKRRLHAGVEEFYEEAGGESESPQTNSVLRYNPATGDFE